MAKSKAQPKTAGQEFADQISKALYEESRAPLPGARDLPVLKGVTSHGGFSEPQENIIARFVQILVESERLYIYGDTIAIEISRLDGNGESLVPLRSGGSVEVGAEDLLANVVVCEFDGKQFPLPKWLGDLMLRSEPLVKSLPRIRHYSTKPMFDEEFVLRGPGWHADVGILVHGPDIEIAEFNICETEGAEGEGECPAIERLPYHLRTVLGGFCFQDDADVINAVGVLLTGLLMNHFVAEGKGVVIVDGNQPSLGKTLLVQMFGVVLSNTEVRLIHFTSNDEELQKRICATLRDSQQSVLLIDNAKLQSGLKVSSPAIEANSTAPVISLRLLGTSENFTRPNDVIWALTMNNTQASPDLVSRSVPIRLFFEGNTKTRPFDGPEPMSYAFAHRLEILGELAGMVVHWNQQGRPPGEQEHRLGPWAQTIGGILATAGFPQFLANADAAAESFSSEMGELAALAEAVIQDGGPYIVLTPHNNGD